MSDDGSYPRFDVHELMDEGNLADALLWISTDSMRRVCLGADVIAYLGDDHGAIFGLLHQGGLPVHPGIKHGDYSYEPIKKWIAENQIVGIIDETKGGIIGYSTEIGVWPIIKALNSVTPRIPE